VYPCLFEPCRFEAAWESSTKRHMETQHGLVWVRRKPGRRGRDDGGAGSRANEGGTSPALLELGNEGAVYTGDENTAVHDPAANPEPQHLTSLVRLSGQDAHTNEGSEGAMHEASHGEANEVSRSGEDLPVSMLSYGGAARVYHGLPLVRPRSVVHASASESTATALAVGAAVGAEEDGFASSGDAGRATEADLMKRVYYQGELGWD